MGSWSVGGVKTTDGKTTLSVATKKKREGLLVGTSVKASRDASIIGTSGFQTIRWNTSNYSTVAPIQVRFRGSSALRILSDVDVDSSGAASFSDSSAYTSVAASTWSDWEEVFDNVKSNDSNVICGLASVSSNVATVEYEVRCQPRVVRNTIT